MILENMLVLIIGILVAMEYGLRHLIRWLRQDCQWLITEVDDFPTINITALRKFLDGSFDPLLGWVRRPNTVGVEKGANGTVSFQIDEYGARYSGIASIHPPQVAAFGDSYVFGRQVDNHETWCALLGNQGVGEVLNFGVGNYGADQGLLRYENTILPPSVKIVILGFVPETICRIHSYWKHYLEFGNTFAFKPRFILNSVGDLELVPCAVSCEKDFLTIRERIEKIHKYDDFYKRKFRILQFRGCYLLSLLRRPRRQFWLILSAVRGKFSSHGPGEKPFTLVVKRNIEEANAMYQEEKPQQLLRAIIERFAFIAQQRGHLPLILILPQLYDLYGGVGNTAPYQNFFSDVGLHVPLLDMTEKLRQEDIHSLYVEDSYGGHLSARGNVVVARYVAEWIEKSINTETVFSTTLSDQ